MTPALKKINYRYMKNKNNSTETVQQVMVKYIAGGKEVVKYNILTGECWIERHKNDGSIIVKQFSVKVPA